MSAPCGRQGDGYTERMFGYPEASQLGARRRGGPVLLKHLLPAVLEDLREVCAARAALERLDDCLTNHELRAEPPALPQAA